MFIPYNIYLISWLFTSNDSLSQGPENSKNKWERVTKPKMMLINVRYYDCGDDSVCLYTFVENLLEFMHSIVLKLYHNKFHF